MNSISSLREIGNENSFNSPNSSIFSLNCGPSRVLEMPASQLRHSSLKVINLDSKENEKSPSSLFHKASTLTKESLDDLLVGRILAISVENYMLPEICNDVAKKILKTEYQYYDYAEDVVGRYGMSYSEVQNENSYSRYYSQSISSINKIRSIFSPYLAPVDRLRLELEEMWPRGAGLEEADFNEKMFVGLCRVIDPNKIVLPHQDDIRWDSSNENVAKMSHQLAVNIYLKIPEKGGELELWDYGYEKQEQYKNLAAGSYGIEKSKLPDPSLTIKPKLGELVIFNPRNLHCILPGDDKRLTQSCFIGHRGEGSRLTFWS